MTNFQAFSFATCAFLFFISAAITAGKDETTYILFLVWILLISVASIGTLLV